MIHRLNTKLVSIGVFTLLVVLTITGAYGQSQATTGNIEGRIVDSNGAVVPNASVKATNQDTGLEKSATADGDGNYRVVFLPPGKYTVSATAPGFGDVKSSDVTVTVGGKTTLDVSLSPAGVSNNQVTVTSESTIETTRTSISTTVDQKAIENLPINGRNFQDFATLTPGVIRDPRGGDLSVGGQVADVPDTSLTELARLPGVSGVSLDRRITGTMERTGATIGSTWVRESLGFDGTGIGIAVIDSGVANWHDDLGAGRVTRFVDFVNFQSTAYDDYGHGTHVAGILVGSGSHSPDGRMAGVAPQANLVSVRVLDGTGRGLTSDVMAGLQWILDNKAQYGIRVVNLSLGHPVYEPASVDPLVQAVDALWDAGVVVVCSAGNAGRNGYVTVSSPCNSRKAITVGAINDHGTPDISDDTTTTYSSRGPTALDLVAKPDLVAPGNRIVSLRSAGSYQDLLFPDRRVAADPAEPGVIEYVGPAARAGIDASTIRLSRVCAIRDQCEW